ncbi:MAG: hypothetical protein J6W28_06885 [Clostridia bacterium]|nr:hypothetical protein [Clostridia bacterium]
MKKILSLVPVLGFLFALVACGATPTRLGTSDLSILLPDGYAPAEDDLEEDQVAYFYKDENSIDFDVYQWEKGDQYTLESEAQVFAAFYGTEAEAVTVNGLKGMKYVSIEQFEGATYTVVNYMFEDDTYIVELAFWTVDTDAEYADVEEIIGTLKRN